MKNGKGIIVLILCIVMCLCFLGCGKTKEENHLPDLDYEEETKDNSIDESKYVNAVLDREIYVMKDFFPECYTAVVDDVDQTISYVENWSFGKILNDQIFDDIEWTVSKYDNNITVVEFNGMCIDTIFTLEFYISDDSGSKPVAMSLTLYTIQNAATFEYNVQKFLDEGYDEEYAIAGTDASISIVIAALSDEAFSEYQYEVVDYSEIEGKGIWCVSKYAEYYGDELNFQILYQHDQNGNETQEVALLSDGSIWYWSGYEYDTKGNRTKEINYNEDGSITSYTDYERDSAGNITVREVFDEKHHSLSLFRSEFMYDDAGRMIERIDYDSSGSICAEIEYRYDNKGNKYTIEYYSYGSIYEFEYDSEGKVIMRKEYDPDGFLLYWLNYEYDTHGNIVKFNNHYEDGTVEFCCENEYEYDIHGNIVKFIGYDDSNILMDLQTSCSGDETYRYDTEDMKIEIKYLNEYDANGNMIKHMIWNNDGSLGWWVEYEYTWISTNN